MTTVCCVCKVALTLKSNNFCEASQVKHCQRSKSLPSPKQECSLLINRLDTASKNYGTNSPTCQKNDNCSQPKCNIQIVALNTFGVAFFKTT